MKTRMRWLAHDSPNDGDMICENSENLTSYMSAKIGASGQKNYPSPKEFVAFGQAGCTGVDIVATLKKMREPFKELTISCDIDLSSGTPSVFEQCRLQYEIKGENLNQEKVARAVSLSLQKYCGVSAMIERSGCIINPILLVNNKKVSIWDCDGVHSNELRNWYELNQATFTQGLALVIGASRGIGRSLCMELAEAGYGVIPAARGAVETEKSPKEATIKYLDITNPHSRNAFVEVLKNSGLKPNIIIYNAGILDENHTSASDLRLHEIREVFDTNVFSIIEINNMLIPLLPADSTLIFTSSHMGLPDSNDFDSCSYRLSKGALTLFARKLGKEFSFQQKNIAVAAIHPGSVKTTMNPGGKISTVESAKFITELCSSAKRLEIIKRNGEFWTVSQQHNKLVPLDL